jgi:hypothetical protein
MSLVKTIGELSDYANSVGGLLRLKRREEKWVHIDEWISLNQQVKELTEKLVDALSDADKRISIHKQEFDDCQEMLAKVTYENDIKGEKLFEANKIIDAFPAHCFVDFNQKTVLKLPEMKEWLAQLHEALK